MFTLGVVRICWVLTAVSLYVHAYLHSFTKVDAKMSYKNNQRGKSPITALEVLLVNGPMGFKGEIS